MLYQTHALVSLANIGKNLAAIRKAIGPERKLLVSVKADAYGHGAVEVASFAEKNGADWFGVATVPEGLELKEAGIRLPILKFSPVFPEEMEAAIDAKLHITVCEESNITMLNSAAANLKTTCPVHLKVDTGMGRLGVSAGSAAELAMHIEKNCPSLYLEGIFTHLPIADDKDKSFTQKQTELFKKTVDHIHSKIGRRVELLHAANSAALLQHEEAWFDMLRPGIMVYGYYPDESMDRSMELFPALSFKSRVTYVKKISAGTRLGYGLSWSSPSDSLIATIPVGYADGFNRLFSNRGRVLINGRSYPIVGRVCMDQCMVDLGPDSSIKAGDEVVLLGKSGKEEISCYELAKTLGTITYEVSCQISKRVKRYYN